MNDNDSNRTISVAQLVRETIQRRPSLMDALNMQEETETRIQSTYSDGDTVYFRQMVDDSGADYSKVDGVQNAIDYIE